MTLLRRTPIRTFVLYPIIVVGGELALNRGTLSVEPLFIPLMIWGYLQYRLSGHYRIKHGGGGPGLDKPPERLVTSGPFAYTRNPMYLGHLIFLTGLTLTLQTWLAGVITVAVAIWFHLRVVGDEKNLAARLGKPYINYAASVKRWIPGVW